MQRTANVVQTAYRGSGMWVGSGLSNMANSYVDPVN
jgi:hypothetical protein